MFFISLIEEDLRKVRKRLVYQIIVLERFSKVSGRSKVPQRRNLCWQGWFGHQIDIVKTTVLRLTNSEKPPFLWTRERSCLGIPARWDNISCKLTPRSISSSIKPHSGIKLRIFVDHLHDPQPEFCYKSKTHRHRKEKFAIRGNSEHRIRRHRGTVSVCNSVWTKFLSPTVRSTLVFP